MKRVTTLLLPVLASACMTGPRPIAGSPSTYLAAHQPDKAWVVLENDQQMVIDGPRVVADTIFGYSAGEPVTLRMEQLKNVRVRRLSVVKTAIIPTVLLGA